MKKNYDRKPLSQSDNYARGVNTPVQKRYDDVVAKYMRENHRKPFPWTGFAVTGNVQPDVSRGGEMVRYALSRERSVYPIHQLATLTMTFVPTRCLRPSYDRSPYSVACLLTEMSFFRHGSLVQLGGRRQQRPPRERRFDRNPRENLLPVSEVHFRPSTQMPTRELSAPMDGMLAHRISKDRDGDPYHHDVIIRQGNREVVVIRFYADAMEGVKFFFGEEKHAVKEDEPIILLEAPVTYGVRKFFVDQEGRKRPTPSRDLGRKAHPSGGEILSSTDKPLLVETGVRMFEGLVEADEREEIFPVTEWAPQQMLELPMPVERAIMSLCLSGLLHEENFYVDLLSAFLRGEIAEALPGLSEDCQLRLLEYGPAVRSFKEDLRQVMGEEYGDLAAAWLRHRVIGPGQHGYQGNGVLFPYVLCPSDMRKKTGEQHLFFPRWAEGFQEDLKAYIAPAIYTEAWNAPCVPATMPGPDAAAEDWGDDFETLREIATDDDFAWCLNGVSYSFRPANGTLDPRLFGPGPGLSKKRPIPRRESVAPSTDVQPTLDEIAEELREPTLVEQRSE